MVKVLIFSGYGINCETETQFAFELAGAKADIVHINDLIKNKTLLRDYQILAFPGGFSFGDDTGSGKAFASMIRNHLYQEILDFIERDTLSIGICNGFQILTQLNLLEGSLHYNDNGNYICRWVDLEIQSASPWLKNITKISLPIAHGEGKFWVDDIGDIQEFIAMKYFHGEISQLFDYPSNPNGSLENIAGVTSPNGRILGLMPHPERAIFPTQLPHWTKLKINNPNIINESGHGLQIFKNAVEYFR